MNYCKCGTENVFGAVFKSHILQYRSGRCSFLFSRDHGLGQGLDFSLSGCDSVTTLIHGELIKLLRIILMIHQFSRYHHINI